MRDNCGLRKANAASAAAAASGDESALERSLSSTVKGRWWPCWNERPSEWRE